MEGIVQKFQEITLQLPPVNNTEKNAEGFVESVGDRKAFCRSHHMTMATEMSTDSGATTSTGRPKRSCRDNAATMQRKLNSHRSVMKKKSFKPDGCASKLADITKIYTKQTLSKFRPVNLETVFELPEEEEDEPARPGDDEPTLMMSTPAVAVLQKFNDLHQQVCLVGAKKFRRSLTCRDGINTNKTLQKKRRDKIKRNHLPRHRKIPMDAFLSHLKSLVGRRADDDDDDSDSDGVDVGDHHVGGNSDERDTTGGGDHHVSKLTYCGESMETAETETHTFAEKLLANLQKFANAKPPTDMN